MLCSYRVMKECIAYETWHRVVWLDGEDQNKALHRWIGCKCEGQVRGVEATYPCGREAWAKIWRRWTKATVKSKLSWYRWTNKVTWWYEVDHIIKRRSSQELTHHDDQKVWWWLVLVVTSTFEKMKWNAQDTCMTFRTFYFTGQRFCRQAHDQI